MSANARTWHWCDPKSRTMWVFGMRWLPVLGSKGQRAMQRNLRQQGFRWAVNHGGVVRLIGVQSSSDVTAVNRRAASAAVAFARAHPEGVHALCLEIPEVGFWLVASSQGSVLSDTDRWFDTLDEAEACLKALRDRYETIAYETLRWQVDDEQDQGLCPPFLQGGLHKQCRFSGLPTVHVDLPWVIFGLLALALAVFIVYTEWLSQEELPVTSQNDPLPAQRPPVVRIHRAQSLEALVQAWQALPVDPEGWILEAVNCRIDQDTGLCKASYKRRLLTAHNEGLIRHIPDGWTFEPDSLDRASLKRAVNLPMQILAPHHRVSRVFGLTQLQRLSSRTAAIEVGSAKAGLYRAAPDEGVLNAGVEQAAMPEAMVSSRSVTIRVALRHFERVGQLSLPLRWHEADLAIVHGAQIDQIYGYLMLNLKGDWLDTN
ncbi:MAG: hypothetical protein LRY49_11495 [Burkholderiaceae bacterium]|nr:hypothetical protein [Burkholderiaceae bacterium]